LNAIDYLEKEKSIPREVLIETIEAALMTAYKKNYTQHKNVKVDLNIENGSYRVISRKDVVEEVEDPTAEIDLATAGTVNPAYEIGDPYDEDGTAEDFNRVGAPVPKQAVIDRLVDAESGNLYNEFIDKEDEVMTGLIDRVDNRFAHIPLGRTDAVLTESERMPTETYTPNESTK